MIPLPGICDGFTFIALSLLGGIIRAYYLGIAGLVLVSFLFFSPPVRFLSLEPRESYLELCA